MDVFELLEMVAVEIISVSLGHARDDARDAQQQLQLPTSQQQYKQNPRQTAGPSMEPRGSDLGSTLPKPTLRLFTFDFQIAKAAGFPESNRLKSSAPRSSGHSACGYLDHGSLILCSCEGVTAFDD
jgi:hypothetical protein